MGFKRKKICRLCLKVAKNKWKTADRTVKIMLDILLVELDWDLTRNPIICQDCLKVAKKCLNFKYTCVNTERVILLFSIAMKKAKYEIKDICKEGKNLEAVVGEDLSICRFCMTQLERNHFVSLDILMEGTVVYMLSRYLPELDFNIIDNPTICTSCKEMSESYLQFVRNCLNIERKIKSYCKEKRNGKMYQIKLSNVLRFLFILDGSGKCPPIRNIKQESNRLEYTECVYPEAYNGLIKQEELDIKEGEIQKYLYQQKIGTNTEDGRFHRDNLEAKWNECSDMQTNHVLCTDEAEQSKNNKCNLRTNIGASEMDIYKYAGRVLVPDRNYKSNFKKHELIHKDISETKMLTCSLCAFESKHKEALSNHVAIHKDVSKIKMLKCSLCTYESRYKGNFNKHMLVHKDVSEIEMVTCSLCAYGSKYKSDLIKHMLVHKDISELKMFTCSLCTFKCKLKSGLTNHMLVHKDISEVKMFKCSLCGYKAKFKGSLNRHMLIHKDVSKIKIFTCSLCTYKSRYKGSLNTHMLVHGDVSKIKMFTCSFCAYKFTRNSYLKKHMLIHKDISEIKMFTCSLCAFESRHKRCLKTHMLVHKNFSEIEIFKCSLCAYESKHKGDLSRHMMIHKDVSEVEMFKCSSCAYESKHKGYLSRHMIVHKDVSEMKMLKCPLCPNEYKHKRSFTRHMLIHN